VGHLVADPWVSPYNPEDTRHQLLNLECHSADYLLVCPVLFQTKVYNHTPRGI
jgi:hypothetical protein